EEVERMLDKRTSMGIVGDLNRFGQYAQAEAMLNASNRDTGMGAGLGAGVGAAIGMGMGAGMLRGPWGPAPAPLSSTQVQAQPQPGMIAPPPVPSEPVWHVALDGQPSGPYGKADLGRLMNEGRF